MGTHGLQHDPMFSGISETASLDEETAVSLQVA